MLSDGQNCYTYNDANQISKVKKCSSGQTVSEYLYDYTGRRIVKKEYENGILKQTVYSPDKNYETKKLANNSTQNTSYYYANDELVARKNPDSSKVFYLNDHLNSTNILTDATGKLIEETTYYPYGDIQTGGTNSKYLYTGQEKDLLTGLNYYGARYYNSHIRRFTQPDSNLPDPYDPQQLNRYTYVRNNPLKYVDPSGNVIQIPAALGLYAIAVANSPDLAIDMNYFSQSSAEFMQHPNAVTGLGALANLASIAIPGESFGPAAKAALKSGGDELVEQGAKAVARNANEIGDVVKGISKSVTNSKTTGSIYWSLNEHGYPTYIGKTIDFDRRAAEHYRESGRIIQRIKGLENVPANDLTAVEQSTIEKFGLKNLENIRNAISPMRSIYNNAIETGKQYLKKVGL